MNLICSTSCNATVQLSKTLTMVWPIVYQHNTTGATPDTGRWSICILAKLGTSPPWLRNCQVAFGKTMPGQDGFFCNIHFASKSQFFQVSRMIVRFGEKAGEGGEARGVSGPQCSSTLRITLCFQSHLPLLSCHSSTCRT